MDGGMAVAAAEDSDVAAPEPRVGTDARPAGAAIPGSGKAGSAFMETTGLR